MSDGRIYVGNLPKDVQERDIEDLFFKYGKIRDIELKNNRGTIPFAFVRFEDPRDAEDAVFGRNGYGFGDCKLRVEYPRSSGSKFSGPAGGGGPRGRFGPPSRRSEFRVIVTGELRGLRLHARIIPFKIVLITLLQLYSRVTVVY
uniref:Serine/arginine-rich splicing factor 9-like n=1 Tax=Sinocyclocheilus anshuiensis TaxID=1608454 RepID=A0A671L582_9TELE